MAKCGKCGLLTLRTKVTRELCELELRARGPQQDNETLNFDMQYEISPLCLAQKRKFSPKGHERLAECWEDFECDSFIEYFPSFSPKEHAQMLNQKILLEHQRLSDEADRAWQERQEQNAASRHRLDLGVAILAALICSGGAVYAAWYASQLAAAIGK